MKETYRHISIKEFEGNKFRIKFFEQEDPALLSHYLHNYKNELKVLYKDNALKAFENYLKYKREDYPSIVAEEALEYLLFEVENVPFPTPKKNTFTFIDLFAGIGGFRLALQKNGGRCLYSSEYDPSAKITYRENFGEIPFGDITKVSTKSYIPNEKIDILCAGFPCQPFSIAGYRKGFSDTRGTLFFDIEQIVEKHKPKVLFLENVKNLVSHNKGQTFKVIIEILEKKLKYKVYTKVLNAMTHANVPQNRERIFIIAFDPKQVNNYSHFKFPNETPLITTIHDIIEHEKAEDKYYYKKDHIYYPELERAMTSKETIYQWRRVYVRENKSQVCPTLTANMGTGGHNVPLIKDDFGFRKLTPRECFSFQGFPKDYILPTNHANSKLYMQAGNSVTVPLIEKITKEIIKIL